MSEVTFDRIFSEVKRVRLELKSIEKTLESLVESLMSEEEISPKECKEIRQIEREMAQGECITFKEAQKKKSKILMESSNCRSHLTCEMTTQGG
jgi:hypothetical protein